MRKIAIFVIFFAFLFIITDAVYAGQQDFRIEVKGDISPFSAKLEDAVDKPGVRIYNLTITASKATVPNSFKLFFRIPVVDICSQWKTNSRMLKFVYPNWSSSARITSRATSNAPVLSLFNSRDQNRLTFACSDALNTIIMRAGIKEEDAHFDCEIVFFSEKHPPISKYQVKIRIDTRDIPFYDAIAGISAWWAANKNYRPMQVPEHARLPMYSSWYSFHQNLVVDEVLHQCRLAKKMGYHSVIIDDGWQTLDNNRGYSYTGDWKPERIPQMRTFVDQVHKLGMKFILWYSVPYIGDKSKNYHRFKGKYLRYWKGKWGGSYTLDPRYPDVREFLITTYEKALEKWDIDGFKLDFVDSFIAYSDTELTVNNGRDYASVNQAVDRLMTDIKKRLTAIKPDILIEFRQSYIGPLMRKYGNMFRAGDCPDSYLFNRIRTIDLRILSGTTPVHADMVMWHAKEPVESAALQMLNILFSVPQLSVRLDSLPASHLQMISFWTRYWQKNRSVLLDGKLSPQNPAANYPVIQAQTIEQTIIALYDDNVINFPDNIKNVDIVNGKFTRPVVFRVTKPLGKCQITLTDCTGKVLEKKHMTLKSGIFEILVPPSGLLQIRPST